MQINPIIESGGGMVNITSQVTPVTNYVRDIAAIRSGNVVSVGINLHQNVVPPSQILRIAYGLPKTPINVYGTCIYTNGAAVSGFVRVNADGTVDFLYYEQTMTVQGFSITITYITNE